MPDAPRPPAGEVPSRGEAPRAETPSRPPGNIRAAIEHAEQIQGELERVLEDINEILRILELSEREKNASEDEIEHLRESLRRLQCYRGPSRPPRDYPERPLSQEPREMSREPVTPEKVEPEEREEEPDDQS